MRLSRANWPVWSFLCLCAVPVSKAQIVSRAEALFPWSTRSLEYDNLKELRKSPDYPKLRQQYTGASFTKSAASFARLGITEDDIDEVVRGAEASDFYGIASGQLSRVRSRNSAAKAGIRPVVIGASEAFCPGNGICIVFLQDSVVAFGTQEQLKNMLDANSGKAQSLKANRPIMELLNKADATAPVIGVAPGSELTSWIGDALPKEFLSQENVAKALSNIELFVYSVKLGNKAHIGLDLRCKSSLGAETLSAALKTLSAMQSIGSDLGSKSMPFENMTASASGKDVSLKLDADVQGG